MENKINKNNPISLLRKIFGEKKIASPWERPHYRVRTLIRKETIDDIPDEAEIVERCLKTKPLSCYEKEGC